MLRRLSALIIGAIIVSVVAAACGSDDPTPTPVVVEKEVIKEVIVEVTPTPTSLPTATPTVDPDTITYNWRVMDSIGFSGFLMEAVREMLDISYGGRITLTPEDSSRIGAIQFVNANPGEYEKTMFTQTEEDILLWSGDVAFTGAPAANKRPAAMYAHYPAACTIIFTRDSSINTVYDLAGKRVYTGSIGHTWPVLAQMLFDGADIAATVDVVTGGKPGNQRLPDGEIDAVFYGYLLANSLRGSSDPPTHQGMLLRGDYQVVDIPLDLIAATGEKYPLWRDRGTLTPIEMKKGGVNFAAGIDYDIPQKEGMQCIAGITPMRHTSPDAPEQVVYLTVRAVIENKLISDDYFPFYSEMWQQQLGHYSVPQEFFHPGAQRAYEEAGQTYGLEGMREWEAEHPSGELTPG